MGPGRAQEGCWTPTLANASSNRISLESKEGLCRGLACLVWESIHPVEGSCLGPPGICVSATRSQPAHWRDGQAHWPAGEDDPLLLR